MLTKFLMMRSVSECAVEIYPFHKCKRLTYSEYCDQHEKLYYQEHDAYHFERKTHEIYINDRHFRNVLGFHFRGREDVQTTTSSIKTVGKLVLATLF